MKNMKYIKSYKSHNEGIAPAGMSNTPIKHEKPQSRFIDTDMRLSDVQKEIQKIDPNAKLAYGKTFKGEYKNRTVHFKIGQDNKIYIMDGNNEIKLME